MDTWQRLLDSGANILHFGLIADENAGGYFCTPLGMRTFARTGVDGEHFGQIEGQGETVFLVQPMAEPYVLPVAENRNDFVRLLLACGEVAPLFETGKSEEEFAARCRKLRADNAAMLKKLNDTLGISPLDDPYAYLTALREGFNEQTLSFPLEYYEALELGEPIPVKPWEIRFPGTSGKKAPGKELPIDHTFCWNGKTLRIPAVYACKEGLAVDLCLHPDTETMHILLEKSAALSLSETGTDEQEMLEQEADALMFPSSLRATIRLGNKEYGCIDENGFYWNPNDEPDYEGACALAHYRLDPEKYWAFRRLFFYCGEITGRPHITLTLSSEPRLLFGPLLTLSPGQKAELTHPVNGKTYTLTVIEAEEEMLPEAAFQDTGTEFPRNYLSLSYTLDPPLPDMEFSLRDTLKPDEPRVKETADGFSPIASPATAIGIIGGADGPTAIFFSGRPAENGLRNAISSLTFRKRGAQEIKWRARFRAAPEEPVSVVLEL